jgi:3-hexulose-6-phosphate synthase/6-phospho-3-hexuloisomerase
LSPIVQVSIDLTTIEAAFHVADIAVRAGVDWLEAGTPLLLGEGLHAVAAMHARYPNHPIVADLKTMDAGYLETEMMAKAGASFTVVMSRAHWGTVKRAVAAARDYGIKLMADVMLEDDKPAAAKRMEELGVDYIICHTGFDERAFEVGKSPVHEVEAVVKAVGVPVQAVGGLSIEQAMMMPKLGAPLVVVGAPLVISAEGFTPAQEDEELERVLREVVAAVKGQRN